MKGLKNILLLGLVLIFVLPSCKQDLVNPNNATDQQVLSTRSGIIALSIGLRQNYSTRVLANIMLSPDVTAREVKGVSTFINVIELENGGTDLPVANINVLNYWSALQAQLGMCQSVIDNAPGITDLDPGMLSGIMAHAYLFKAMTLSQLAMAFEQANINTSETEPVTFVSRKDVLDEAIRLIDLAIGQIENTPPSQLFQTTVTGGDFDLVNTIYAIAARINLIAEKYGDALDAANEVDLNKTSRFVYSSLSPNPLYNIYNVTKSYFPRVHFGLPDSLYDKNDGRLSFFLGDDIQIIDGDEITSMKGFTTSQTGAIPVYTPDEVRLIKAESILRTNGSLNDVLDLINEVRTQTNEDPFGVNANLPSYSGEVSYTGLLGEVYKQRCAELYLSGLKWEDTRRFNRPAPPANVSERNRIFYPYPEAERIVNPNTPADPGI